MQLLGTCFWNKDFSCWRAVVEISVRSVCNEIIRLWFSRIKSLRVGVSGTAVCCDSTSNSVLSIAQFCVEFQMTGEDHENIVQQHSSRVKVKFQVQRFHLPDRYLFLAEKMHRIFLLMQIWTDENCTIHVDAMLRIFS